MTRNACLRGAWSKGNATFNYLPRGDSSDQHNTTQQSTPSLTFSPSFTLSPQSAERIVAKESYDTSRPIFGAYLPQIVPADTPLAKIPPPKHYYSLKRAKRYKCPPSSPPSSLLSHHHLIEYPFIHPTFIFPP